MVSASLDSELTARRVEGEETLGARAAVVTNHPLDGSGNCPVRRVVPRRALALPNRRAISGFLEQSELQTGANFKPVKPTDQKAGLKKPELQKPELRSLTPVWLNIWVAETPEITTVSLANTAEMATPGRPSN